MRGQHKTRIDLPMYSPLACGYCNKSSDADFSTNIDPVAGIKVFSCLPNNDSVFSLKKGKVLSVEKVEDEYVCSIKFSGYVLTYSNLLSSPLKKGMNLNKGDFIGNIFLDENVNFVRVVIRKNGMTLTYEKHIKYLKHKT